VFRLRPFGAVLGKQISEIEKISFCEYKEKTLEKLIGSV
jgi:hypothetical protein|tara:strand:+ start:111964 stop:112080 length:117 start_codon:yes stop_codon:yes gene_type:complete